MLHTVNRKWMELQQTWQPSTNTLLAIVNWVKCSFCFQVELPFIIVPKETIVIGREKLNLLQVFVLCISALVQQLFPLQNLPPKMKILRISISNTAVKQLMIPRPFHNMYSLLLSCLNFGCLISSQQCKTLESPCKQRATCKYSSASLWTPSSRHEDMPRDN